MTETPRVGDLVRSRRGGVAREVIGVDDRYVEMQSMSGDGRNSRVALHRFWSAYRLVRSVSELPKEG